MAANADRCRILVVEDDNDTSEAVVAFLKMEGYFVTQARDGREAVDHLAAAKELPCAIFLDLMMPVMDGYAFYQQHLANPRTASIPVVVTSASVPDKRRLPGAELMRKPMDGDLIVRKIAGLPCPEHRPAAPDPAETKGQ